ncbi:MAG: MFS transporter, partial [Cyanobacteria bacterium]|nr:MFS transporter [Cyanobacteriota bacterium]
VAVVVGLAAFGAVFAMNSSIHSYMVLAYTDAESVSLNVGFYYMANAAGRLLGTLLSGALFLAGEPAPARAGPAAAWLVPVRWGAVC